MPIDTDAQAAARDAITEMVHRETRAWDEQDAEALVRTWSGPGRRRRLARSGQASLGSDLRVAAQEGERGSDPPALKVQTSEP